MEESSIEDTLVGVAPKSPEGKLFAHIIANGIKDKDVDYLKSGLFRKHSRLIGLDPQWILSLTPFAP